MGSGILANPLGNYGLARFGDNSHEPAWMATVIDPGSPKVADIFEWLWEENTNQILQEIVYIYIYRERDKLS